MHRWIGAVLAALLVFGGGPAFAMDTGPDVVGGQPTDVSAVPWQVALIRNSEPDNYAAQFCGGSIIAASWILTAAHCVDAVSPADIAVLAGTTSLRAATARLPVAQIIVHPGWDTATQRNDIALLRMSAPLPLNGTTTAAVSLPTGQDPVTWPAQAQSTIISGWGSDLFSFPDTLNTATTQILAGPRDPVCGLYGLAYDPASMLCAGLPQGGVDTCQGDSGGPLVVNVMGSSVLAGITSWGQDCAEPGYPGVYTRVTSFTDWIGSGTGVAGQVSASTNSLAFGEVQVGTSASQTVSISNPAEASQPLTALAVVGTDMVDFPVATTCHGYLASGASCTVTVTFQPTAKGPKTASLHLGPSASAVQLVGLAKPPLPDPVIAIKARVQKRKIRLSWTPALNAVSYEVTTKGKNRRGKRVSRGTEVTTARTTLRISLTKRFSVCVTPANESGAAAKTCRTFRAT